MDWDEMARPWLEAAADLEQTLGPVHDALFEAARLVTGEMVLDVGCGTGPSVITAAAAVGPSGHVTGVDIAPPLLEFAKGRVPENVSLVLADAGSHAFEEAAFDVVISNFGTMFFEDTMAAFANLRKAVRPGGRLAATVWGPPQANPYFSRVRDIVDRHVADVPRPDPAAPGPMRFGDPTQLVAMMREAGWAPAIQTRDILLTPPGPAEQVASLHMKVTAGMMLRGVDASDAQLADVKADIVSLCGDFDHEGVIRFPAQIHVVTAVPV